MEDYVILSPSHMDPTDFAGLKPVKKYTLVTQKTNRRMSTE